MSLRKGDVLEYPLDVTLIHPCKMQVLYNTFFISDYPTRCNFTLWNIKELIFIYKYCFWTWKYIHCVCNFQRFHRLVLFLIENYLLLHYKDTIFCVIYHSFSIYHKAWHRGQLIFAEFWVTVEWLFYFPNSLVKFVKSIWASFRKLEWANMNQILNGIYKLI